MNVLKEDIYPEWIKHVFDHPIKKTSWYFDLNAEEFIEDDITIAGLLHKTFLSFSELTLTYSDEQIAQGLNYLFNTSCSNYCFVLKDGKVKPESVIDILLSIKHLYQDLFNKKCEPVLSSQNAKTNPLNVICYMLWDITTLLSWKEVKNSEIYYEAISEVMEYSLNLPNIACKESSLHGLGHLYPYYPEKVKTVITNFIRKEKNISPDLLEYATNAAKGAVL